MISVKWREKGTSDYKVLVAAKLRYIGGSGEIALYDADDNIVELISPAHLQATPTVNAPRKGKED